MLRTIRKLQRNRGISSLLQNGSRNPGNLQQQQEPLNVQDHQAIVEEILSCGGSKRPLSEENASQHEHGSIVQMHLRCGNLADARSVFDKMPDKGVLLYTAMLGGYARRGDPHEAFLLFRQMQAEGVAPNRVTFVEILRACVVLAEINHGKLIHGCIVEAGLESDPILGTAVLNMYGKCGSLKDAKEIFKRISRRDVISWNALILVCVRRSHFVEAVESFKKMQMEGIQPNKVTFITILTVFQKPGDLAEGKLVHSLISESGLESAVTVGNAILNMYGKCRATTEACMKFNRMQEKDVVSWNVMISAYAQLEDPKQALELFHRMLLEGVHPETITFINILNACTSPRALHGGKLIHACVMERSDSAAQVDIIVATALVTMFAKCGSLDNAREVFIRIQQQEPNVVLWNAMITACVQHEQFDEALQLFRKMQLHGLVPDNVTFISIVNACASLEATLVGRSVHARIVECGHESDMVVATALVDMYSRGGYLVDARQVFGRMPRRDLVAWNVLIAAYIQHGDSSEALKLFHRMELIPDKITFITILGACATSSALPDGRLIHTSIAKRGFLSDVVVATALVDMYGKCGSLDEALRVFCKMPGRNVISWNSIIAAYAQHGDGSEVLPLARQMQQDGVEPDDITFIGILSACSHAGLLDDGCHYFAALSRDHGIVPMLEHYGCLIDLLGRAGKLEEAEEFIKRMPFAPNAVTWTSLLAACNVHGDVERGRRAARHVLELDPGNTAAYVVLSNSMLIASARLQEICGAVKEHAPGGITSACKEEINGTVKQHAPGG